MDGTRKMHIMTQLINACLKLCYMRWDGHVNMVIIRQMWGRSAKNGDNIRQHNSSIAAQTPSRLWHTTLKGTEHTHIVK